MFLRQLNIPKLDSFFLFGARGTGKSTWLRHLFPQAMYLDLLVLDLEREMSLSPQGLAARIRAMQNPSVVIIDEIQKVPALLNEVHRLMEGEFRTTQFVLTGSSARQLKAGSANLLAGRAVLRFLFPFSFKEVRNVSLDANAFLKNALSWGTLPRVYLSQDDFQKKDRLDAYTNVYLKEEIWAEQIIRKLDPFRRFLEVAAQTNGKVVNAAAISRDVGADPKTVQAYFQILEDTLIGFQLDAFHTSVRKRLRQAPKFYFFDTGVCRSLARQLNIPLSESTSVFGDLFESFLVNEIYRRNLYESLDYRLSYLCTASNLEVDLVLDRPGMPLALVEIKSTRVVREDHVSSLAFVGKDFPDAELICLSRDPIPKSFGRVRCLPWEQGLYEL